MPTPSAWAIGVASPSYTDPYQGLEESISGPIMLGAAGGEVVAPNRRLRGHVSEITDWRGSPAIWVLAAILIAIGVLHLGGGIKLGPARASAEL
jgi:hypothetical protein